MLRRAVVAIGLAIATLSVAVAMPPPGATQDVAAGADVERADSAHRAAVAALDEAEDRVASGRAELASIENDLTGWTQLAGEVRSEVPELRRARAEAQDRLAAGKAELRRLAAFQYVSIGTGRLENDLFSTEEVLQVLRRHLLIDLADQARLRDVERDHDAVGEIESELSAAEQRLADIDSRLAELAAQQAEVAAGIDAAEAEIPDLADAVARARTTLELALAPPTTTPPEPESTMLAAAPPASAASTAGAPTTGSSTTTTAATPTNETTSTAPTTSTPAAVAPTTIDHRGAHGGRAIALVGDSLLYSARQEVAASLGSFGSVEVDAVPGRALIGGQEALDRIGSDDPDVVVIALGTNDIAPGPDYGALVARSVDAVEDARCVVWVDVQAFLPGLVTVNQAIGTAAVDAIARWSAVAGPPELHLSDGYHLTERGQWAFAGVIADTVAWACGAT